jgi:transposase InsO family protein
MHEHRGDYPLALIAKVFEVSTSGYYEWLHRPPSARQRRRQVLAEAVRETFHESHENYGSRKVTEELVKAELNVCRNTVARIMREENLRSRTQKRRFVITTNSDHADPIAPNRLARDFHASRPDQKWVADITYVPTATGWAYVAAVMDLFSRKIVGWAVSESLESDLVIDALDQAIRTRRPASGLVHHSDRGCQYASERYRRLLDDHRIACSMSRRGDCWDNAPMERLMNSLKNEWTNHHSYRCVEDVQRSLFHYIEIFYNRRRRHQALGYLPPEAFEVKNAPSNVA